MPIGRYSLRLQSGITGGFAPPTPNAIYTIASEPVNINTLAISSSIRPLGMPELEPTVQKFINSDNEHTTSLVDELYHILKVIPTEDPIGSQDIYGLDTSIAWESNDLQWMNGGPQGCSGGVSTVQPTEEDKVKFKRAVEIVYELVGKEN